MPSPDIPVPEGFQCSAPRGSVFISLLQTMDVDGTGSPRAVEDVRCSICGRLGGSHTPSDWRWVQQEPSPAPPPCSSSLLLLSPPPPSSLSRFSSSSSSFLPPPPPPFFAFLQESGGWYFKVCGSCVDNTRKSLPGVLLRNGAVRELEERRLTERLLVLCEWQQTEAWTRPERVARRRVA